MTETKKYHSIQVSVSADIKRRLTVQAAKEYVSTSSLARRIIAEYLDRLEGDTK